MEDDPAEAAEAAIKRAQAESRRVIDDLNNIRLWRFQLLASGQPVDPVPPLSTFEFRMSYLAARRAAIMTRMTDAEIIDHCRRYKIRLHGRLVPSPLPDA